MSNVVEFFRGRVGLGDSALLHIQQLFKAELAAIVQEEIRPLREICAALMVQVREIGVGEPPSLTPSPVAKAVSGLDLRKAANEIIALLFKKLPDSHPSRLRPFYTDLERESGVGLSEIHRKATEDITKAEDGKYPYRKMDTVLTVLDPEFVHKFAKAYRFSYK